MRPNTPHIVFTLEHAICTGGHFYATSTLQDTLYALEHNFFLGHLITNTDHIPSRLLLRRLAHFFHKWLTGSHAYVSRKVFHFPVHGYFLLLHDTGYNSHVPDLAHFEGVLDLFALSTMIELMNVLHPGTYRGNGLSRLERDECAVARGKCRDMLQWFFTRYDLFEAGDNSLVDGPTIYWEYLARHVKALLLYAEGAQNQQNIDRDQKDIEDGENTTTLNLQQVPGFQGQVDRCFEGVKPFQKAFDSLKQADTIGSLAWPRNRYYVVCPTNKPTAAYRTCGKLLPLTRCVPSLTSFPGR
jgi:hypothetical protein